MGKFRNDGVVVPPWSSPPASRAAKNAPVHDVISCRQNNAQYSTHDPDKVPSTRPCPSAHATHPPNLHVHSGECSDPLPEKVYNPNFSDTQDTTPVRNENEKHEVEHRPIAHDPITLGIT